MLEDLNKLATYIEKLAEFTQELRAENRNLNEQLSQQKTLNSEVSLHTDSLQTEMKRLQSEVERLEKAHGLVQLELTEKSKENDKLRHGLTMAIERIHSIVDVLPKPATPSNDTTSNTLNFADIQLQAPVAKSAPSPITSFRTNTNIPSIAPNHENSKPQPMQEVVPLTSNATRWS